MNPTIDRLIRKGPDPILSTVCARVEPGERLDFLDLMERVCRKAPGIGLAAPQIGVAKRVIFLLCPRGRRVVADDGQPTGLLRGSGLASGSFMINPEIVDASDDLTVLEEGCLSYPGVYRLITRHAAVLVKYLDVRRVPREEWVFDLEARVVQHEVEHLDGVCKVGDERYAPASLAITPDRRLAAAAASAVLN